MKRFLLACLLSLVPLPAFCAMGGTNWHCIRTPHFEIYHESSWAPMSISLELERIHGRLHMYLASFAPWMMGSKAKVYIYAGKDNFVNGEFHPPAWSRGLAYPASRQVVIFDDGDRQRMRTVLAHELTHLFFESYFEGSRRKPPLWLNEGLAVAMEDSVDGPSQGQWASALKAMEQERVREFSQQMEITTLDKAGEKAVSDWYLQSFGMVKYLLEAKMQFRAFCAQLRDGAGQQVALGRTFHFRTPGSFEQAWLLWAFNAGDGSIGSSSVFTPVRFKEFKSE